MFEVGERVWILKPGYRAPLGEFQIVKALADDKFELIRCSDSTKYREPVEGKHLRRYV